MTAIFSRRAGTFGTYALLVLLFLLPFSATAQSTDEPTGAITGTVTDAAEDVPLEGVNVVLPGLERGAATGSDGTFRIPDVPAGTYRLEARFVGYAAQSERVTIPAGETRRVSFALRTASVNIGEIEVTALRPGLQTTGSLDTDRIQRAKVADPGALLRMLTGVGSVRRGPIGLDPNVRGLSETEVGVYINSMRAFPAGPARMDSPMSHVDPSTIASIDVVKGPYALTWGPGNMSAIRVEQRGEDPPQTPITGMVRTGYDSNRDAVETTGFAMGRQGNWSYSANVAWRSGSDYQSGNGTSIPGDYTSGDVRARIGVALTPRSTLSVNSSYQRQDDLDYPGRLLDATFFKTGMGQVQYAFSQDTGLFRNVTASVGAQQTLHEMDNEGKPTFVADGDRPPLRIGVASEIQNVNARLVADLQVASSSTLKVGTDALHTYRNALRTLLAAPPGRNPFVPPFYRDADGEPLNRAWPGVTMTQVGTFVNGSHTFGNVLTLTGTTRLDVMQSDADDPTAVFLDNAGLSESDLKQEDVLLSGSVTASMPLATRWTLSLGAGSVARPPSALERYADRFPSSKSQTSAEFQGDPTLDPERSTQLDLSVEGSGRRWQVEVSGFYRDMQNYITLAPTTLNRLLPLSPPTVFTYVNGTATFVGAEADLAVSPVSPLTLRASGSWTWGRDDTYDEPAFGIMPPTATLGARWRPDVGLARVTDAYLDGTVHLAAKQDRVAVLRNEAVTDGYTTVDVRLGVEFVDQVTLNMGVENLFDTTYVNHLNARNPFSGNPNSFSVTRIPEPGRVLSTALSVQF